MPEDSENKGLKQTPKVRTVNIFYEPNSTLRTTINHTKLQTLVIIGQKKIVCAEIISKLKCLKELWIVECCLKDATALKKNIRLEKLYLYTNDIAEIPDLSRCKRLKILSLARNNISDIQTLQWMPHLQDLNLADNEIRNIPNIFSETSELVHINLSDNPLHTLQDVENLSPVTKVHSIEFGDPVYGECPLVSVCNYRPHLIRLLPSLQAIDFFTIGVEERKNSVNNELSFYNQIRHKYLSNGSLNSAVLSKMFSPGEFGQITHLTISKCSILGVNFVDISLSHLESLDLSNNLISSLKGFQNVENLHTLCLSYNQLGRCEDDDNKSLTESVEPTFPKLLTLYADHNRIRSISDLGISKTSSLKYLFLQSNEIRDIDGIEKFPNLKSLVLDHNRIENIAEAQLRGNKHIKTLLIEKNKLMFLSFTKQLFEVEKLFLANNKITDKYQLGQLRLLKNLRELTILGNPLCKSCNHYLEIREAVGSIKMIDGYSSPLEDKSKIFEQV